MQRRVGRSRVKGGVDGGVVEAMLWVGTPVRNNGGEVVPEIDKSFVVKLRSRLGIVDVGESREHDMWCLKIQA